MSKEILDFLDAAKAMRGKDREDLFEFLKAMLPQHEDTEEVIDVLGEKYPTLGVTFGGSQFFITIEDA
jgi:hypothetical protein